MWRFSSRDRSHNVQEECWSGCSSGVEHEAPSKKRFGTCPTKSRSLGTVGTEAAWLTPKVIFETLQQSITEKSDLGQQARLA